MPKDMGQMNSALAGGAQQMAGAMNRNRGQSRKLGASLAGNMENQGVPQEGGTTFSKYAMPSAGGATSVDRMGEGTNITQEGVAKARLGDRNSKMMSQYRQEGTAAGQDMSWMDSQGAISPEVDRGSREYMDRISGQGQAQKSQYLGNKMNQPNPYATMGNWQAQPNAMDTMQQRYGNGGYQPAWAQPGSQAMQGMYKQPDKPAPVAPTAPAAPAQAAGPINSNEAMNQITSKVGRALNPQEQQELFGAVGYSGGDVSQEQLQKAMGLIDQNRGRLGMGGL